VINGPTHGHGNRRRPRAMLRRLAARAGVRRRFARTSFVIPTRSSSPTRVPLNVIQRQLGRRL